MIDDDDVDGDYINMDIPEVIDGVFYWPLTKDSGGINAEYNQENISQVMGFVELNSTHLLIGITEGTGHNSSGSDREVLVNVKREKVANIIRALVNRYLLSSDDILNKEKARLEELKRRYKSRLPNNLYGLHDAFRNNKLALIEHWKNWKGIDPILCKKIEYVFKLLIRINDKNSIRISSVTYKLTSPDKKTSIQMHLNREQSSGNKYPAFRWDFSVDDGPYYALEFESYSLDESFQKKYGESQFNICARILREYLQSGGKKVSPVVKPAVEQPKTVIDSTQIKQKSTSTLLTRLSTLADKL